jgi:hypothetical protein
VSRAETRPYSRIYYDDLQRDYPHVWSNDHALATFARLLALADKVWPTLPEIPRSVRRPAMAVLNQPNAKGNRLVEIVPAHCYRIRGHHADREKRSGAAAHAAEVRWDNARNADSNADASASAMPRRAEQSKDKELPLPRRAGRRNEGTNQRAVGTNPRANGTSPRQEREAEKRGGMPERLGDFLRNGSFGQSRPAPKPGAKA